MNNARNALPWILVGLAVAAVALAVTSVSNQHAPMPIARAASTVAVAPPPSPSITMPASAILPPMTAMTPMPTMTADSKPEARPGQIWTCTTQGVKTFSNNPCGENSSLLEVGPINTMKAATPARYARAYPDPSSQTFDDGEGEQGGYENSGESYAVVQGVAVLPRRRFEHHPHRPAYHHNATGAPRRF